MRRSDNHRKPTDERKPDYGRDTHEKALFALAMMKQREARAKRECEVIIEVVPNGTRKSYYKKERVS